MTKRMNKSILLIYTGGTIGMKNDPVTGVLAPFDFTSIYDEFPNIRHMGVDIEIQSFPAIDSSNVTPQLWVMLAEIVHQRYDEFDGFVILHGTDTMSYTASALSFMLKNLSKPVVFTGSQIPIGVMRSDGRENLITAIEIATAQSEDGAAMVPEVSLYFQNRLFRANRTTKFSAEELNAFHSENYPSLAEVGVNIHYNRANIRRASSLPLTINTDLESGVLTIRITPGLNESILRSMLKIEDVRGVVLETYGTGNAPTTEWFLEAISQTISRGIPVMNVTQCSSGSVAMELYETGVKLQKAGVISGRDSTIEAAVTKLMAVLGQGLSYLETEKMLKSSLCGEITLS